MLLGLFLLVLNTAQAQFDVMFCVPAKGQASTDLEWVETTTRGTNETYQGLVRAFHRSYGILSADINQIEWIFKDITVPTQRLENSSSYRLILRDTGWTLDEYSDEYQKTFLLDCKP